MDGIELWDEGSLEEEEEEASLELELCSEEEVGVEEDSSFEESAEEALELEEGGTIGVPQANKRSESELRVRSAFLFIASILSASGKQNDTQLESPFIKGNFLLEESSHPY